MASFKVDTEKKTVTVDVENLTDGESKLLQAYLGSGYVIKPKKAVHSGLTYEDMKKKLAKRPKELEELEKRIADKENYMKTKSWFLGITKKK